MTAAAFAVEPFAQVWPQAQALLQLHWREIARDQDSVALAPAVEQYERLQETGQLLIVTARTARGDLIGYHASVIRPHLHYAQSLTAYTDLFFVHPEHRKGFTAWRLFRYVERELARRGVERMFASCKLEADLKPLFDRLGWTEIERVFTKRPGV